MSLAEPRSRLFRGPYSARAYRDDHTSANPSARPSANWPNAHPRPGVGLTTRPGTVLAALRGGLEISSWGATTCDEVQGRHGGGPMAALNGGLQLHHPDPASHLDLSGRV